jgi:hypothetical protein
MSEVTPETVPVVNAPADSEVVHVEEDAIVPEDPKLDGGYLT